MYRTSPAPRATLCPPSCAGGLARRAAMCSSQLTPWRSITPSMSHSTTSVRPSAAIDRRLEIGAIRRGDLQGHTVLLLVEQEPCSSCASGAGGGRPGLLEQFSMRYPELTIEVRNTRTSRSDIYRGGRLWNP